MQENHATGAADAPEQTTIPDADPRPNGEKAPKSRKPRKQKLEAEKGGTPPAADAMDIAALRLPQGFAVGGGVKQLVQVPIRRPDKHRWVRTHPDHALPTMLLELSDTRESYVLHQDLWEEHAGSLTPKQLFLAIDRQAGLFLWPVRLPGPDGRLDTWNTVAHEAAIRARETWVRLVANQSIGTYDLYTAPSDLGEPEWPDLGFEEILRRAFADRFISTREHAVLRRLRGET